MPDLSPFPRRVSSADVRTDDPLAYRLAASGIGVMAVGMLALVVCALVQFEIVRASWLDGVVGLVVAITLWAGVFGLIMGMALITHPSDVRRGIALQRFARRAGLHYGRFGAPVDVRGVLFSERAPGADPTYRSDFELYDGAFTDPDVRLGIASYTGGRDDPRGPRPSFRFLVLRLPRPVPHIVIDAVRNGRLRSEMPPSQRLRFEGDVDRHFAVYVPRGYERDALQLLTPDVLVCLLDHGRAWNVEIVDDRVVVASTRFRRRQDATEVPALLRFATLLGAELDTQVRPYTDPRARSPRTQVSDGGRRLRRRSIWWDIAVLVGVVIGVPALILGGILLFVR